MYSRRTKYYDSESEEEGLEVPTFKDGRTAKASHLSARFKQIEEHDKDDYCPSDESYDSAAELESLSESETQLKLATPITPFAKKQSKTKQLLARQAEPDSESESQEELPVAESPIRKKSGKRSVSIADNQPAFKPINPKKTVTNVQHTPLKPKAVDAKTKALPTKPIVLKSLNLDGEAPVSKPASKKPAQTPLSPPPSSSSAESDQEEAYVAPKTKKMKLTAKAAEEESSLIKKMESLSIMKKKQVEVQQKPKKTTQRVALDEGDESDDESVTETLNIKKSKKAGKENDKSKLNKEGKKKKDPNAPKKPSTGYREFYTARFPELKEENPEKSVADLAKEIGAEWKQLDDEQKVVYEKRASRDKKRYQAEMAAYNAKLVAQH